MKNSYGYVNVNNLTKIKGDNYISVIESGTSIYKAVSLPNYPDEISDSGSANYNEEDLLGRTSPLIAYTSTGLREVSFSFDVHRDEAAEIENLLRVARASVYPNYSNSYLRPTITAVRFGSFYMKGITRSYSLTWKKPIIDGKYQVCTISMTLADIPSGTITRSKLIGSSSMSPFHDFSKS